jgi:phage shock protein E
MWSFLKKLVGSSGPDLAQLVREGAKIIDVRSKAEFAAGHAKGTINIPLDQLAGKLANFKKDEAIIVCCRSGMRSASARSLLMDKGFKQVYNAGPWTNLKKLN